MITSSLSGKPDDYESRKSWTNKDWFTHVGAWENERGQLCFGSSIAFCAMMEQFHRTHTQHIPDLLKALESLTDMGLFSDGKFTRTFVPATVKQYDAAIVAIARAKGEL